MHWHGANLRIQLLSRFLICRNQTNAAAGVINEPRIFLVINHPPIFRGICYLGDAITASDTAIKWAGWSIPIDMFANCGGGHNAQEVEGCQVQNRPRLQLDIWARWAVREQNTWVVATNRLLVQLYLW